MVSAGRPRGGTWPVQLVAVLLLLTGLAGTDGAFATSVCIEAVQESGALTAPPAEHGEERSEQGEPGEGGLRGNGENGRGDATGDPASTRARAMAGPVPGRLWQLRYLDIAAPNAPPPPASAAAPNAPLSGPKAGPAHRAPGARLLIGLQVSRT